MADFPEDRFERAGATPGQIARRRGTFNRLAEAEQVEYVRRISQRSDYELAEELAAHRPSATHDTAPEDEDAEPLPANPPKSGKQQSVANTTDTE